MAAIRPRPPRQSCKAAPSASQLILLVPGNFVNARGEKKAMARRSPVIPQTRIQDNLLYFSEHDTSEARIVRGTGATTSWQDCCRPPFRQQTAANINEQSGGFRARSRPCTRVVRFLFGVFSSENFPAITQTVCSPSALPMPISFLTRSPTTKLDRLSTLSRGTHCSKSFLFLPSDITMRENIDQGPAR